MNEHTFITVNNKKIMLFNELYTILQQCEVLNIIIPRFCYHEKLSIAGNCRICLVQLNNSFKLVVACATTITKSTIVNTVNDIVKNARESIIEFLLINHPLDCPICDQGGECDLQDQTLLYGKDRSRFKEYKRTVFDKNISGFIKTIMTRCIHCTRCVRYFNEVIGLTTIGTVGRGRKTEISNYIYTIDATELSGNVIDLCPVGALTAKPFSFSARA
jgi:NADH dehydrogenase/NADH:ubiquinone oxidoreductase subunit G